MRALSIVVLLGAWWRLGATDLITTHRVLQGTNDTLSRVNWEEHPMDLRRNGTPSTAAMEDHPLGQKNGSPAVSKAKSVKTKPTSQGNSRKKASVLKGASQPSNAVEQDHGIEADKNAGKQPLKEQSAKPTQAQKKTQSATSGSKKRDRIKVPKRIKRREGRSHQLARKRLLVCRWFTPVCAAKEKRLMLSIAAMGRFTSGSDSSIYFTAMTMCALIFVWANYRRWLVPVQQMVMPKDSGMTLASRFSSCWSTRFGEISYAASTIRLFVATLFLLENSGLMAPELNVFATPEMVGYRPMFPAPTTDNPVHPPNIVETAMPTLTPETRRKHVLMLKRVRFVCAVAWCAFVLLPTHRPRFSALLYAIGALSYVFLGTIGLMYNHCHSVQFIFLFLLSLLVVMPHLSDDVRDLRGRRAARWLRCFLFVCVLAPLYFASGVCKLRYEGFVNNFVGGAWLKKILLSERNRQNFPEVNEYIASSNTLCTLFSIGNQVFETGLPLAVWFFTTGRLATVVRSSLLLTAIAFHITIFFLIGPNFIRVLCLLLLAMDPLGLLALARCSSKAANRSQEDKAEDEQYLISKSTDLGDSQDFIATPTVADLFRACFSFTVLAASMRIQLLADYDHLIGHSPPNKRREPYIPFPEYSMFTYPSAEKSEYRKSLALDVAVVLALLLKFSLHMNHLRRAAIHARSHLS